MTPVGRGASEGNVPTRAFAIFMVIDGMLMFLLSEIASANNSFRGAVDAARLTYDGGYVSSPFVCVIIVFAVAVAVCSVYLALLSTIYVKTDVLNNYWDGIFCRPRTII